MADRLSIYNEALILLGERTIVSLSDDYEPRRVFDQLWTSSVLFLHEDAYFDWSIRTVQAYASTDIEPLFGYNHAFPMPDDFVRLAGMSTDENFTIPLKQFRIEQRIVYANTDPMFISFVSDLDTYMWNVGAWTQAFASAVAAHLAFKAANRITQNKGERADLATIFDRAFSKAKSLDAMNAPTRQIPPGTWTQARRGSRTYRGQGYLRA